MTVWTPRQIRTLLLCFVLSMLDGADVLVVSFVAPVLTRTWAISDAAFGLVFSAGLAGMMIGALALAPFADVRGRRFVVLGATLVIASGMLGSALAENALQLSVLRFWTGLGIGAMLASITSLASEFAPEHLRSLAVTTVTAGYPAGATIAGFSAAWIIPQFGWHGMFVMIGAFSALLFPILWFALPESAQFLETRSKDTSQRPPVRQLFRPDLRVSTLLLWGAFFVSFITLYFLTSWIPRIATGAGYPLATAINGSAVFNVGAFLGLLVLGWLAARVGLAKLIAIFFVASALAMCWFGLVHSPVSAFYFGLLVIGFLVQGGFGGLYALVANIYPIDVKATGVGWAIGMGRFGAIAGPALGGLALSSGAGLSESFAAFAVPMLIASALTLAISKSAHRAAAVQEPNI